MDPIVITGCGWVTPFAAGSIREVLTVAATAAPPVDAGYWPVPEELLHGTPGVTTECRQDAGAHLAAAALEHARRDAGLGSREPGKDDAPTPVPGDRVGMVLGCALAGQGGMIDFANDVRGQSARFVSPIRFPQTVGNYIAGALARAYDIRGPNSTLASGIAAGLDAIVEACAILHSQRADLVYAGGVERLTPALARGLSERGAAGAARAGHCSQSSGTNMVFSDGACWFVLERQADAKRRGATVRAAIESRPSIREDEAGQICSVAGVSAPGAICIEHWIGRCLGALSAAALAAGIAAATGHTVPTIDQADPTKIIADRKAGTGQARPVSVAAAGTLDQTKIQLLVEADR